MKTTIGFLYVNWKTIEKIYDGLEFGRVVELIPEMQRLKAAVIEFDKRDDKREAFNTEIKANLFTRAEIEEAIKKNLVKPSEVLDLM
jgi:hypothetical protein